MVFNENKSLLLFTFVTSALCPFTRFRNDKCTNTMYVFISTIKIIIITIEVCEVNCYKTCYKIFMNEQTYQYAG